MLYLLAILVPPLACLCAGKFWHAVLNALIMLCTAGIAWPVAAIHAWLVVKGAQQQRGIGSVVNVTNVVGR